MRLLSSLAVRWLVAVHGICTPLCTKDVQHRDAQGVSCVRRIEFLLKQPGVSEKNACRRVGTRYKRACGPCVPPEAARPGLSPAKELWVGPGGRAEGACRTSGKVLVVPQETDITCRAACASDTTCAAYEFVPMLVLAS